MAENTIDTLSLQIESDAQKSFKSIDRLTSSLIGLGKATDRINAKSFGNLSQNIKSFSSAVRGLKNVAIPDFSGIVNSFTRLNGATFDTSGINNVAKALKGLASVDMGKFNGTDFSQITSSIGQLVNIPDVSNSLNRFVSSLQKLANAGDKITPVANNLPILGNSLRNVVNTMAGAATVSDSVNQFTQSIGRLASAGAKTTQTAAGLDALAEKTKGFFASMQNAPQVSENTIRMTQALAQLAAAGGNVGTATDSISSGFSRLSSVSSTLSNTVSKVSSAVTKAAKKMVSAFKQIGNSSRHVNKASSNLKTLLKTALGFGALRGLFNLGKEAVEFSSDLTEVQNVVDVTFGNMAYKVEQLAKTSIGDFGMSELTLKQISSRFQAMGGAMGFAQGQMSDMSIELTKLAADMASFYNVEQADVAKDLESIFTGQTRPLRTYGLDLTQATLAEWAMKNGLDSNIQSMSQLEKTMLRYQYVLANTGAAQGDFARTAGTWANQTRILKQNLQQLSGIIGQGLIAALLPAIKVLNVLMSGLTKVATLFRDFMYVLTGKKFESGSTGITSALSGAEDYEYGIADAGNAASDALDGTSDSAKKLKKNLDVADYDELRILKQDADDAADSLGDLGGSGIGDVGLGDISDDLPNMEDWLKNSKIEQPINKWASRIRSAFLSKDWERLGRTVADGLNKGLKRLYDLLNWKKVGKKITGFTDGLTRTFNSLVDYFDWDLLGRTVGTGVNTVVNTLNQLIEGTDWKNLGRKFATGVNGLFDEVDWKNLGNLIGNKFMIAWNTFSGFVENLKFAKIGRNFARLLNGVFEKIDFSEIALSITNAINGTFVSLLNFTRTFKWEDLKNNVTNGINTALSNMKWEDAGKSLNAFLLDLGNFMLGVAEDVNWEEFGKGIGDFLSQIDWATHFNNLLGILKEVLGGIWTGLGDTSAGKFVQGIITFKLGLKLMPFVDGIVKFFTGKTVIQKLSGGIQRMLGKSLSDGASSVGTAGAEKGLLSAAKEKLSGIGSGGAGTGLLTVGAGLAGGVLLQKFLKKIDEAQEKMSGKNGIISQLGLLTNALGYPADKGLEQKINDLTESLENANAPVSEWATQFSDLFKKAGVSVDDLNQLLIKGFGGAVNFAGEQGALYEQIVAKMSEAEANASASDKAAAENRAKGYEALRTALENTSKQGLGLESQFELLREKLDEQETSGQNVESAYQHIIDLMDGWGVNIAANKDLISLFGDEVDTTMSEIGVSFQNASSNIQTATSGINQNISAVKTEADNASTATNNIGTAASNVVGSFLTFAANALLMSTGLGSIETGSKNAGSKLSELGDNITNFVGGLATSAKKVFDEGKKTGANFPTGFAKGISEKEKEVVNASQKLVDSVTNPVKTGLDINSPSGVARGFGQDYVQGLINGITSRMGELGTAIGNIVKTMTNQFSSVLFQNFRTYGQNLMISLQNGIYSQHISLPYIRVMAFDHYTMGNSTLSIPRFGLQYYAKGGLFTKPGFGIFGEGKDDEAALPLNDSVYKRIATGIVNNMPKIDIGNIEINRSQAPYVTTSNIPRSTYSNSFGEDLRKDMAAISSNTFNSNANIGQAVKEALNGAAIYAEDHIIGYLQFKNQQARNQNGGLGFLEV